MFCAKPLHSSSKIVNLRSLRFRGIQMYKINFVSRDLCTRCGPVCLRTLTLTCLMTLWVGHYRLPTKSINKNTLQNSLKKVIATKYFLCSARLAIYEESGCPTVFRTDSKRYGDVLLWNTLRYWKSVWYFQHCTIYCFF